VKRIYTRLFGFLLAVAPLVAQAADTQPSAASSISQMMLGLGIVLALLYGTLMILRRLQQGKRSLPGGLKVLSATSVGPRERVVMVSAGKNILVLGVAPGRVNMLHVMEEGEVPVDVEPPASGLDFSARLKQLMERPRREP